MPPVKNVGKPCAGEPHARFDGRGLETEAIPATVEAKAARGNPRQERPDLQPNQSPPRQPPTLLDRDHWCCHRWQWLWQGRCWFRRRQVADDVSEAAHQARPQQAHLEAENRPRNRADRNKQAGHPCPPSRQPRLWGHRARQRDDASGNHCRKGDSEARKHDVKAQLLARLRARRHEAGWGSSRQRDARAG